MVDLKTKDKLEIKVKPMKAIPALVISIILLASICIYLTWQVGTIQQTTLHNCADYINKTYGGNNYGNQNQNQNPSWTRQFNEKQISAILTGNNQS